MLESDVSDGEGSELIFELLRHDCLSARSLKAVSVIPRKFLLLVTPLLSPRAFSLALVVLAEQFAALLRQTLNQRGPSTAVLYLGASLTDSGPCRLRPSPTTAGRRGEELPWQGEADREWVRKPLLKWNFTVN